MAKIKLCKEQGCNNAQTTQGYCRFHYLKNYKRIKSEKERKAAERLNKYIEAIVAKYPDRYMDVLKKEIRSRHIEGNIPDEFGSELDDVYKIFSDPGYEEEIERLIKDLRIEDKF